MSEITRKIFEEKIDKVREELDSRDRDFAQYNHGLEDFSERLKDELGFHPSEISEVEDEI